MGSGDGTGLDYRNYSAAQPQATSVTNTGLTSGLAGITGGLLAAAPATGGLTLIPAIITGLATLVSGGLDMYGANQQAKQVNKMNDLATQQYDREQKENKREFNLQYAAGREDAMFNKRRAGINDILSMLNGSPELRSNYAKLAGGKV